MKVPVLIPRIFDPPHTYSCGKFGKIKQISSIYLARKYPRPKVYNIPHKTKWILNNKLNKDINISKGSLQQGFCS